MNIDTENNDSKVLTDNSSKDILETRIISKKKKKGKLTFTVGYVVAFSVIFLLLGAVIMTYIIGDYVGGLNNLSVIRDTAGYDTFVINELLQNIEKYHFGDTPDSKTLIEAGAHAVVDAVGDRYAAYFTTDEYESYTSNMNGNYSGIGIAIYAPTEEGALIHRVYEGTFAEAAGLKPKDMVIAIDGVSVRGIPDSELTGMITGETGTSIVMTVIRDGETLDFTVTRGDVYIKRIEYMMLENNIGYIYVTSFTGDAYNEYVAAVDDLIEKGAKSLIVDLRYNPGGSLYTVVDMCDVMLPECTICSMQGKTTDPTKYYESDSEYYDLPLVVLVNGDSASASEIFAGAMQDNDRGVIIGTQTFGKGIVQTTVSLSGNRGWLKLTTDAYFTPDGTNLNGTGITPDIVVELPGELMYYDVYTLYTEYFDEDTQLKAAVDYLSNND